MKNRVLIVGAGRAGRTLAADLVARGDTHVVGFLDDFVQEDDVLGRLDQANAIIAAHAVTALFIAIPSASSRTIREFIASIAHDEVDLAIVPRSWDILARGVVRIEDLTDVDVLDLVGRQPVQHDLEAARAFMRGRTVMVTGAAGSIGSRLLRKLLILEPARVIGIDRSEPGIFNLDRSMPDSGTVDLRIGDIGDVAYLDHVLAETNPSVVYHAAAYKHVPLMEKNPREAIVNNLGATLSLLDRIIAHGVEHGVLVSTDKAVNPVNVMGATKRLGEIAMEAHAQRQSTTRLNAVRFGNVIESSGSVMQVFREQISQGKSLTVTHPDVTRYFMTLDEASQLIIQTTLLGNHGEVFLLDMGEPVRIYDLAASLIRATRPELTIEIIGMRPGEKLFEELTYDPEAVIATAHDSIFVTRDEAKIDPELTLASLAELVRGAAECSLDDTELRRHMSQWGINLQG